MLAEVRYLLSVCAFLVLRCRLGRYLLSAECLCASVSSCCRSCSCFLSAECLRESPHATEQCTAGARIWRRGRGRSALHIRRHSARRARNERKEGEEEGAAEVAVLERVRGVTVGLERVRGDAVEHERGEGDFVSMIPDRQGGSATVRDSITNSGALSEEAAEARFQTKMRRQIRQCEEVILRFTEITEIHIRILQPPSHSRPCARRGAAVRGVAGPAAAESAAGELGARGISPSDG